MIVAGIMSGTSLDGIDVALVDIKGRRFRVLDFWTVPYPARVRQAILKVSSAAEVARLHFLLGELYAEAVANSKPRPELIACHGQTIHHEGEPVPFLGRRIASTLQIGAAAVIAERTGIPVVSDFRPRDIAAGGRGAPLVPLVDYLLFRHPRRTRVALNIGGIANVTIIPAGARPDQVIAFDTGPGNMVIDALVEEHTNGRRTFDKDGKLAAEGRVDKALLGRLLAAAYYRKHPPKTAGREQYGRAFVERLLRARRPLVDLIATATVLTASTIALGIRRFAPAHVDELIVSGGGAKNPAITSHLEALLPGVAIATSSDFGIDSDAKEAIAFAILGYETWRGRPSNLPSATGARRTVILGSITPAPPDPAARRR
ncbi:MAG TPA: anhydro-N-acetylmuramic acid kinase [Bryobacteraceae bacterium]|nr:anhydro-N-acetylmuramic acid kinase [Bryobacteraceae bacterium]